MGRAHGAGDTPLSVNGDGVEWIGGCYMPLRHIMSTNHGMLCSAMKWVGLLLKRIGHLLSQLAWLVQYFET